jgi:isoprenylcysteine carboxyl methyltransferase (ICMT) family protein YpbQ
MHPGFWWLAAALGLQRLAEMAAAARNTKRLLAEGARLVRDDGYGLLVTTHSLFFVSAVAEALLAPWAGIGPWTLPGLTMLMAGEGLPCCPPRRSSPAVPTAGCAIPSTSGSR